jgi:hypothetical protein
VRTGVVVVVVELLQLPRLGVPCLVELLQLLDPPVAPPDELVPSLVGCNIELGDPGGVVATVVAVASL